MEPADDRREQIQPGMTVNFMCYKPQWSPPLAGGNTDIGAALAIFGDKPQWSLP
jgi:hypothetical protein